MNYQQKMECRMGVPVGEWGGEIVPRPAEGRHVRLGMRVRLGGDGRWFLMIRDQTGPGRHRR